MSSSRKDYADYERLTMTERRGKSIRITAVQSATLPANMPSIVLMDVSSTAALVNFLPAEADSEGKIIEVWTLDTNSGTLYLKNASGDVKAIVPTGGYARLACVSGVWRAGPGNSGGTFSAVALGADFSAGVGSGVSAVGFSSIAEYRALETLVNRMKNLMIAHGWAVQ